MVASWHRAILFLGLVLGPLAASAVQPTRTLTTADGMSCVAVSGVICWNADGSQAWQALTGEQTLALTDAAALLTAGSAGLAALDPATGIVQWRLREPGRVFPPVSDGTQAWFGTHNGALWCIDASTGAVRWRRHLSREWVYSPALADNTLVATGRNRRVWGLAQRDGEIRWARGLPQEPVGIPAAINSELVFLATYDGTLQALKASTGRAVWMHQAVTAAAEWTVDTDVLVRLLDGTLLRLDAEGGQIVWRRHLPGARYLTAHGDRVWVSAGRTLNALERATGRTARRYRLPAPALAPVTETGEVAIGGSEPHLHTVVRTPANALSTSTKGG